VVDADLTTQDGRAVLHVSDPNAINYESWCKLYAVYGEAYTHSSVNTGQVSTTGRAVYAGPMVEELKRKLLRTTAITQRLGTAVKVEDAGPQQFRRKLERFMDSSNDVESGQYWPLVRRVRVQGNWEVLKSGAVFVDAPGVNDSNTSRDKVVKGYLKEADAIWIVSNINRAVNDKTAKDMLDHSFRRQLLMDGAYGSLIFVATQSDVIQRSEVVRSMGLQRDTDVRGCAQSRCDFTAARIRTDFHDGLEEMGRLAGDAVDRAELEAKFTMPVFCVSSFEYQKLAGLRAHDGPAEVWANVGETQIPALRRHVHRATLAQRAKIVRRECEALIQYGAALVAFTAGGDEQPAAQRAAAKRAFDAQMARLPGQLEGALGRFDAAVQGSFDAAIVPQLRAGAGSAQGECMEKMRGWGGGWSRSGGGGGLHWATYKACCRRHGAWKVDMNEQLAEPVLSGISTNWERVFVSSLQDLLGQLSISIAAHVVDFHAVLAEQLGGSAGVDAERLRAIQAPLLDGAAGRTAAASDAVKTEVQRQQKELSRSISPMVQVIPPVRHPDR
jgi:hypothetical protein